MAEEFEVGDKVLYLGCGDIAYIMKVERIYEEGNTIRYIVRQEDGRAGDGMADRLIKLTDEDIEAVRKEYKDLLGQKTPLSRDDWQKLIQYTRKASG
jgi:hypothetical protein